MNKKQLEAFKGQIAISEDEVSKLKADLENLQQHALGDNPMTTDEALQHFEEVNFIQSEISTYEKLLKDARQLVEILNRE